VKFIQLPVIFDVNNPDVNDDDFNLTEYLDSGKYDIDYLYINQNFIDSYNVTTDKRASTLRMVGSDSWCVLMEFEKFEKLMEGL